MRVGSSPVTITQEQRHRLPHPAARPVAPAAVGAGRPEADASQAANRADGRRAVTLPTRPQETEPALMNSLPPVGGPRGGGVLPTDFGFRSQQAVGLYEQVSQAQGDGPELLHRLDTFA